MPSRCFCQVSKYASAVSVSCEEFRVFSFKFSWLASVVLRGWCPRSCRFLSTPVNFRHFSTYTGNGFIAVPCGIRTGAFLHQVKLRHLGHMHVHVMLVIRCRFATHFGEDAGFRIFSDAGFVNPQIWAWGGLIAGLQKQGAAVGAANAATLTG